MLRSLPKIGSFRLMEVNLLLESLLVPGKSVQVTARQLQLCGELALLPEEVICPVPEVFGFLVSELLQAVLGLQLPLEPVKSGLLLIRVLIQL